MKWKFPQTRLRNLTPPSPTLPPVGGKEGGENGWSRVGRERRGREGERDNVGTLLFGNNDESCDGIT